MRLDGFSLTCSALAGVTFIGFRGTEHVSQPYEFELFFSVPANTDARKAVGERATVRASRGEGKDPLVLHGVIASVRLLHQNAERALYQALLVPKLWLLRHFWRSHVFTNQPVKEFLSATLTSGGLAASEFRFSIDEGDYPTEEFVAQYRETHLAFFHRWLEREGLYYYFEHPDDGSSEVLVIVDDRGLHDEFPGGGAVRYVPLFGEDVTAPPGLHHLEQDVQWLPKSVTIADYNYSNPSASVKGESSITAKGLGTIREYGYRVFMQSDAERLAQVRAQSIGCREVTLRGSGDVLGPRAGYRFSLDDQPADVVDDWLALEVHHAASVAGITPEVARLTGLSDKNIYRMKLLAIPAAVQFRAPQATPWPRIYGFENAIVCGPADSQYAQIDGDGRYLVRFEFDTSGLPDARISTRVRMMQPHGGTTEGFHFPLRKGTEVMIAFLGGDPDRPFIAGVVPNAHRPSVVGERNLSQNIIRTGSGNQLVLEDEAGKEFIFLHTPNNRTGIYMGTPSGGHSSVYTGDGDSQVGSFLSPENADPAIAGSSLVSVEFSYLETTAANGGSWIGGDSWENVGGNKSSMVVGNLWAGVGGTYTLQVTAAATETYYATRTTTIKTGRVDTVEAGGMKQTIADGLKQTITGGSDQKITGETKQDVHGVYTQTIEPEGSSTVTGPWKHKVTAENFDDYKSWKTEVATTWNGHFAGNVDLKSDTSFVIKAPSAKISATDLKWEVLGMTFDLTPNKHELYIYKGASGVLKTDHAVIYQAAYGLKLDFALVKVENAGAKKYTYGAVMKQTGAYLKQQAIGAIIGAVLAHQIAITKL
ncbi:type VI secretion system Vgr family protein [Sorangium sp. So ce388]|uniref:type VI secretion system Vgr family protein n=1 Tax=Sorangium sp. So ce388 TaxID=3133309 RepID=UPI003F5C8A13